MIVSNPFSRQHRRVRMHLREGGESIEGIFAGRTKHEYIIWAPRVITADEQNPEVEVSGHVEIPRENVQWYQVIG